MILENNFLIELKSVERMSSVYSKQVLTYLKLLNLPSGLLINFGAPTFKEGCKRIVNQHPSLAASRESKQNLSFSRFQCAPEGICPGAWAVSLAGELADGSRARAVECFFGAIEDFEAHGYSAGADAIYGVLYPNLVWVA